MSIISIFIALIFICLGFYLLSLIPMNPQAKVVINVLAGLFVLLWALQAFGLYTTHISFK